MLYTEYVRVKGGDNTVFPRKKKKCSDLSLDYHLSDYD